MSADGGNAQTQVQEQQSVSSTSAAAAAATSGSASGTAGGSGKKSADELFADLEREISQQRGDGVIFGIQRHVYTGKSSEGNRFIGNDMLR